MTLSANEPALAAAQQILGQHSQTLRRTLKQIRQYPKNVEFVHRLRVVTRRTATSVRFFAALLEKRSVQRVQKALRKLRRRAGQVRDRDVLLTKAGENAKQLRRERRQAARKLRPETTKTKRRRWKNLLLQLVRTSTAATCTFRQHAHEQLRHTTDKFFNEAPRADASAKQYHRFRIQAKKVRYTLELLRPLAETKPVLDILAGLQEVLGQANDATLCEQAVRRAGRRLHQASAIREWQQQATQAALETQTAQGLFWHVWNPPFQSALRDAIATVQHALAQEQP